MSAAHVTISIGAAPTAQMTTASRRATVVAARAAKSKAAASKAARPQHTDDSTSKRRSRGPLAGVCAMVDVRVGAEAQIDCSDVVARKLRELGATIVSRFCPKLTHMVLSHLTPTWKLKISKWQAGMTNNGGTLIASSAVASHRRNLKIVSQLWVNACYVSKQRMEEKPFFPVSKASDSIAPPRPTIRARHSLGPGDARPKRSTPTGAGQKGSDSSTDENMNTTNGANVVSDELVPLKMSAAAQPAAPRVSRKRRRAMSMEPMASDAILKILEGAAVTPAAETTPEATATAVNVIKATVSRAKRRKTISSVTMPVETQEQVRTPPTMPPATVNTVTPSPSDCVPDSCSENEDDAKDKKPKSDLQEVSLTANESRATRSRTRRAVSAQLSDATTSKKASPSQTTPAAPQGTKNPGLALKSGIWSCSACGCSNPRSHSLCRGCQKPKDSPAGTEQPKPPISKAAKATISSSSESIPATPVRAPPRRKSLRTNVPKTPPRQTSVHVEIRSPTESVLLTSTRRRTPSVPSTPSVITLKTPHKPPTTGTDNFSPSIMSAALKRLTADSPLSTPPVKRRRMSKSRNSTPGDTTSELSALSTPQSVVPVHRQSKKNIGKTAKPAPKSKTPVRKPRVVIGITGLDSEARGVIECAVHAIDASMSGDVAYRKARVVKSLDYAAAVTHLVVGKEAKRTIKVLFAIARGAWIVPEGWVFSSLEQERWLPEEEFELPVFANKGSRLHPESRQIFKGMKLHVGPNVEPSREVMQSLIQCAGGEVRLSCWWHRGCRLY